MARSEYNSDCSLLVSYSTEDITMKNAIYAMLTFETHYIYENTEDQDVLLDL